MITTQFASCNNTLEFNSINSNIFHHLWYRLLNAATSGTFFTHSEIAKKANCTPRTVYSALKQSEARGEIKVENRGRNGVLITMLEKGWKLTLSYMKTSFLAYFRDKGLIPFIYTSNTSPSGGETDKPKDRVEKMCAQDGLTEAETRAVKAKVNAVEKVKSLGGLVKHFIKQIKEGALMAVFNGNEIEARRKSLDSLRIKAEIDTKADMQIQGIVEPKAKGALMTVEEFDSWNHYQAVFATKSVIKYNQLCIEAGLAKAS